MYEEQSPVAACCASTDLPVYTFLYLQTIIIKTKNTGCKRDISSLQGSLLQFDLTVHITINNSSR